MPADFADIEVAKSTGINSTADFVRWCRFWMEKLIEDVELEWIRGADKGSYDDAEELVLRAGMIALRLEEASIAKKCFVRRYSPLNAAVLFAEILGSCNESSGKRQDSPEKSDLQRCQLEAYRSYLHAASRLQDRLGREPEDKEAYEYLKQFGFEEYRLPSFTSWVRYVTAGRKHFDNNKHQRRHGRDGRSVVRTDQV